jgi:predicted Ser/Thr protein kinase
VGKARGKEEAPTSRLLLNDDHANRQPVTLATQVAFERSPVHDEPLGVVDEGDKLAVSRRWRSGLLARKPSRPPMKRLARKRPRE